jgi:uncharacterized protein (DUF2236 family)
MMRRAPILPAAARPLQTLLIRAAVGLLPQPLALRLELGDPALRPWQRAAVAGLARTAGRLPLAGSPPVEASLRLGLPRDFLYRR